MTADEQLPAPAAVAWDQASTLAPYPFPDSKHMARFLSGIHIGDEPIDALPELQVYHGMAHGDPLPRPDPPWADLAAVARGAQLWRKFRAVFHLILMTVLIHGFCIGRFSEILVLAGYARSPREAYERFLHTAQHVNKWMDSKTRAKSLGQVRCMHAHARQRAKAFWRSHATQDSNPIGVPLSQFDLAHVLLGFSGIALSALRNDIGCAVTEAERADFVHLWRYVGYHLGILDEYNSCASLALNDELCRAFFASLPQYIRHVRPSCAVLTRSCVEGFGSYLGFGKGLISGCLLLARDQPWVDEAFLARYSCLPAQERAARGLLRSTAQIGAIRRLFNFVFLCIGLTGLRYPRLRKALECHVLIYLSAFVDWLFAVFNKYAE